MACSPKTMSWIMIPAVIGFFLGSILLQTMVGAPTDLLALNPEGSTGLALVVYHPGLSDFQEEVTFAFVEGLIESGWACDVATVHRDAPMDVSSYDLLVLGSPTYAWRPAIPMQRYVSRLLGAEAKPTLLLLTAAGTFRDAFGAFATNIEAVGAVVVDTLGITQAAPNEEVHGISDPLEIARRAGSGLVVP